MRTNIARALTRAHTRKLTLIFPCSYSYSELKVLTCLMDVCLKLEENHLTLKGRPDIFIAVARRVLNTLNSSTPAYAIRIQVFKI